MELNVQTSAGATGTMQVSDAIFAVDFNEPLVHQIVNAYMAAARVGSKRSKSRSEVSGGGAKPWRQKGTGRARAGTSRSPIWRSGGVTFAARTRNYQQKVNRKMYRAGMRSIWSELLRQGRMTVVEEFAVSEPKTQELKGKLAGLNLSSVMVIVDKLDENLYLAARNLPNVDTFEASEVNPVDLVGFENILITQAAVNKIGEQLA